MSNIIPVTAVPLQRADVAALQRTFAERDAVVLDGVFSPETVTTLSSDVQRAMANAGVRRDMALPTTDESVRRYRLAGRAALAAASTTIDAFYRNADVLATLAQIVGEPIVPVPYEPEEYLATQLERAGDEHGWHWDDYAYALVFVLQAAPLGAGGELELIRDVPWHKSNPRVHEYVARGPIERFGLPSGSAYLLRAATTLHRVAPLRVDARRTMVCFSYASQADLGRPIAHETLEALLGGP
jgi:hypothetical protein